PPVRAPGSRRQDGGCAGKGVAAIWRPACEDLSPARRIARTADVEGAFDRDLVHLGDADRCDRIDPLAQEGLQEFYGRSRALLEERDTDCVRPCFDWQFGLKALLELVTGGCRGGIVGDFIVATAEPGEQDAL